MLKRCEINFQIFKPKPSKPPPVARFQLGVTDLI
jgi:hypothetical protein